MSPSNKPIAFFDVDGPLYVGFSVRDFFKQLTSSGGYPKAAWDDAEAVFQEFKAGRIPYNAATAAYFPELAEGLRGKTVTEFNNAVEAFLPTFEAGMLPYAKELLSMLAARYCAVTVSATNVEIVRLLERFGTSATIGTVFESIDGVYTGRIEKAVLSPQKKLEEITAFAQRRGVALSDCVAFGDSPGDELMLDAVGKGFALMPDRELAQIAKRKNWAVIDDASRTVGVVNAALEL